MKSSFSPEEIRAALRHDFRTEIYSGSEAGRIDMVVSSILEKPFVRFIVKLEGRPYEKEFSSAKEAFMYLGVEV